MSELRDFLEHQIEICSKEIVELTKLKNNYLKFAYTETRNGRMKKIDFHHLMNEVQNVALQIAKIEETISDYNKHLNVF
jgi:hypothetical protein